MYVLCALQTTLSELLEYQCFINLSFKFAIVVGTGHSLVSVAPPTMLIPLGQLVLHVDTTPNTARTNERNIDISVNLIASVVLANEE